MPGKREREMTLIDFMGDLHSRRLVAVFFAFFSGIAAVSTAVLPGVLHI